MIISIAFVSVYRRQDEAGSESRAISQEEARAGARFVTRLFKQWGLTDAQACVFLGELSARSYARWKRGEFGKMDADRRMRLSLLAGIYKALHFLFRDRQRVYSWMSKKNEDFGGKRPLDIALQGDIADLIYIRMYLDAALGW